ncbi:MAG: hypothetical protein Kow0069_07430 [Promethearchaeota archaeon]
MAKKASKKTSKKAPKKVEEESPEEEEGVAADSGESGETLDLDEVEVDVAETFDEETPLEREFTAAETGEEEMEDVVEDRVYVVPLAKARVAPRNKRAKRAVEILKWFAVRHMKPDELIITNPVNELIWERGIQKPPRKIKVRMQKNTDGLVIVSLPR